MTKANIIDAIAEKTGLTKKDSEAALKATLDAFQAAFKKGEKVQLIGFGTFEVKERAARQGRNPQTGAAIEIPASKSVSFSAGKALKDAIN